MLNEIFINNFVLIDELRINFTQGLNVLTGETGAGKSIIVDALGLIAGDRLKNEIIRDEQKRAVVEAVFDITDDISLNNFLLENGLSLVDDEQLIVSREILPNGRSIARINGRNINISTLKEISSYLLDMHLQHDHLTILKPENYIDYVDSFATNIKETLTTINDLYLNIKEITNKLTELRTNENTRLQRIDFLSFQINEIGNAKLTDGEEEELSQLATRVRNAQHLATNATVIYEALYANEVGLSAYDQISNAIDAINDTEDEILKSYLPTLETMYYNLQDISHNIIKFRDNLDFEPNLLEEIEDRLHEINKLKSKYGNNIKEILVFYNQALAELELLENSTTKEAELEKELHKANEEYKETALLITEQRKKAAKLLEKIVNEELSALNMPNLKFAVEVMPINEPSAKGLDKIDFLFSPNPGEALKPLAKIASGGEISRFILALKIALAEVYNIPTFIFDEIDVGVGGTSLSAMAKKLGELAKAKQVILVTHSPQVASYANNHLLIEKYVAYNQTYTTVKLLAYNEKIKELARMLGGENYTDLTLKHAGEMLDKAILDKA
ncbi:MAG: DNA repair protein RecN [Syntrophomonadaceae bacterium]|nr:DNA repair protein RecN [Syntrophomonadaceae bacterium]